MDIFILNLDEKKTRERNEHTSFLLSHIAVSEWKKSVKSEQVMDRV